MSRSRVAAAIAGLLAGAVASGCSAPAPPPAPQAAHEDLVHGASRVEVSPEQARRIAAMGWPGPAPADPTNRFSESDAAAELGQLLFFDPGLSRTGTVSCASCHEPDRAFTDGRPVAVGVGTGPRRTMTVLDAAHQSWLGWDGRADSLWSQALQPIERDIEMGSSRGAAIGRVRHEPRLREAWAAAFGAEPPDPARRSDAEIDRAFAQLGKAIAAYERKLVTGPSALDRWVDAWKRDGQPAALSPGEGMSDAALRGLSLFTGRAGCWQCHGGPMLSDGEFHALGAPGRPERGGGVSSDPGRYGGVAALAASQFTSSGPHSDDPGGAKAQLVRSLLRSPDQFGAMRTPSLRHAARGGPHFHEGQFETLEQVVRFYSTLEGAQSLDHHQEQVLKRLDLSAREESELVAFLRAAAASDPPARWRRNPWQAQGDPGQDSPETRKIAP